MNVLPGEHVERTMGDASVSFYHDEDIFKERPERIAGITITYPVPRIIKFATDDALFGKGQEFHIINGNLEKIINKSFNVYIDSSGPVLTGGRVRSIAFGDGTRITITSITMGDITRNIQRLGIRLVNVTWDILTGTHIEARTLINAIKNGDIVDVVVADAYRSSHLLAIGDDDRLAWVTSLRISYLPAVAFTKEDS